MSQQPYRILITGSRDWDNHTTITKTLTALAATNAFFGRPIVIVHGACPTGADAIADDWARWHTQQSPHITVERHPAQGHPTQDFGPWPAAGPRRNAHMVGLGADIALAFISHCTSPRCRRSDPHPSHGATSCANLAEQAGIPTRRYTA